MNLQFNPNLALKYTSPSQVARVLTENWVKYNCYCPSCGSDKIEEYPNNKPVADFYCNNCLEDYELKSKYGKLGNKIIDGSYLTMIERIQSESNPNFLFLTYDKVKLSVNDFILIPKHFFVPEIIEKRKPLSENARRAGWTGCNINLMNIPSLGRIYLIKDSIVIDKEKVVNKLSKTVFLKNKNIEFKGWILDILNCIEKINKKVFTLKDIYKFEDELKLKHPFNNFIKEKIRQQLQLLRNMNVIEFKGSGSYKMIL